MLIAVVVWMFGTDVYWDVVGEIHGELFFKGRPTSYWEFTIQEEWNRFGGLRADIFDERFSSAEVSNPNFLERLIPPLRYRSLENTAGRTFLHEGRAAFPMLIQLLKSKDPHVRLHAAYALNQMVTKAQPAAFAALVQAASDEDPAVADWAGSAASRMAGLMLTCDEDIKALKEKLRMVFEKRAKGPPIKL